MLTQLIIKVVGLCSFVCSALTVSIGRIVNLIPVYIVCIAIIVTVDIFRIVLNVNAVNLNALSMMMRLRMC